MPRLWISTTDGWSAVALGERNEYSDERCSLTLLRTPTDSDSQGPWVALADADASLRINGQTLPLGMRVLRDRDAIQSRDGEVGVMFFSTQSSPIVAPLASEKPITCARCRKKIQPGTPSVRCPACGAVHHQSPAEELECWTYHAHCARCQRQSTALDDRELWTPEGL